MIKEEHSLSLEIKQDIKNDAICYANALNNVL